MAQDDEPADASELRQRLLATALRLFAERGPSATTLRAVAREAGVSLGGLQHHFRTREALEHAVFLQLMGSFREGQQHVFATPEDDFTAFLTVGLESYLRWAHANPQVVRLGARMSLENPDAEFPGESEVHAELVRRVRLTQDAKRMRRLDPDLLLMLVEVVLNGFASNRAHIARRLEPSRRESLERDFAELAREVLLYGLVPRHRASTEDPDQRS